MIFENKLIGNTPLIKIYYKIKGKSRYMYAKYEAFQLTGSIKDRVAYYMIKKAKESGVLKDGMPIIEATSGNTGISLSAQGKYFGHDVYIFMPDWVSKERVQLMKSFGANVFLVSRKDGGFEKCLQKAKDLAENLGGFWINQFSNENNFLAHYETTAEEIIRDLDEEIGGFVSGVGTGGTLMGVGKKLKESFKDCKIVAIEPDEMPMISKGEKYGEHKIEGIGDDFIPDLFKRDLVDDIFLINDIDSIIMAKKIANNLGLGVGISSGANFLGSVLLREKVDKPVVTVFADDNKKYLSTDLLKEIKSDSNFISNNIELLKYIV